jgi:translation initiation factor 6
MHVIKAEIQGNSLVGLYILPLENMVLVGREVPTTLDKDLEDVFGVPVVRITLAGTSLVGVFAATDGKRLLVPHIIFEDEELALEEAGVEYHKIHTNQTCLGNNLIFTQAGCVVNGEYKKEEQDQIAKALGVQVSTFSIGSLTAIGNFVAHNGQTGLIGYEASQEDIDALRNLLDLELTSGTVNLGSTQVHSGIAVNKNGFVIGKASGGPEIVHADEVFGFLDKE